MKDVLAVIGGLSVLAVASVLLAMGVSWVRLRRRGTPDDFRGI